jgi:DNA-binding CsgD family transcriptional regulator
MVSSGRGAADPRAALDLREALGSALDIRVVLTRAYPALLRLLHADAAALGMSPSGRTADFEWLVADLPDAFFASYREMAAHDFVHAAVTGAPNLVLRDQEMIARPALERNRMYQRAREVGAPLEQVMAVMLHMAEPWQSGLAVYRDRRRPFGARERRALQEATPAIANAVRNCRLFAGAASWEAALGALLSDRRAAAVLVEVPGSEIARTPGATALLERWFEPQERRNGLPPPLAALCGRGSPPLPLAATQVSTWRKPGADATLRVTVHALPDDLFGRARRLLLLRQSSETVPLPDGWRARLTRAEQAVCASVLRGWDNRVVAEHVGCAEATVKKHLQSAFDKLGIPSRAALIARAAAMQSS